MRTFLLLLFTLVAAPAAAQQMCLCATSAGCKVASGAWPNDASAPTSCNIYKAGTKIATGTIGPASSVPTNNAASCSPADPPYNPGAAGAVACIATIPQQAVGTTVSLTVRGVNAAGEAPDGTVLSFQSVSSLPTVPASTGLRVTP